MVNKKCNTELFLELEDYLVQEAHKSPLYNKDFLFTYDKYANNNEPLFAKGVEFKELTYKKLNIQQLSLCSGYVSFDVEFKNCKFIFDADSLLYFYDLDLYESDIITQKDVIGDIENQILDLQKSDLFKIKVADCLKDGLDGLFSYIATENFCEMYSKYKNEVITGDRFCETVYMKYKVEDIDITNTKSTSLITNYKNEAFLNGVFDINVQGQIDLDCRYIR